MRKRSQSSILVHVTTDWEPGSSYSLPVISPATSQHAYYECVRSLMEQRCLSQYRLKVKREEGKKV